LTGLTHKPFNVTDPKLRSIASGLVASHDKGINCDIADEIGDSIMSKIDHWNY